ncbi:3-deoxy-8-phosphooctulonate synthase [Alphaproteobacteria bacterium]|nr:3-deoxy-8-phosphooctulonate synthase [Alphaproteobacteria bacterium]
MATNSLITSVEVGSFKIGTGLPLALISGPCQIEGRDHALFHAEALKIAAEKAGMNFIYKSSFDKANRTSVNAARGVGIDEGLRILEDVKKQFNCPLLTDVHSSEQCCPVAEIVDILQIPAFLCRQTDLLIAAGSTGSVINIKKGQFLAPWDMEHVASKVASTGNLKILLTERGTSFGYNNLVSDMRSLPQMAQFGYPVIYDATHSVQQPGGLGGASGGQREFVPILARAAVAAGVSGLFIESHQDPDNAPSDGPNMIPLASMPEFLSQLSAIHSLCHSGYK